MTLVTSDRYRKAFVSNQLLNLYSGFHYFKKSDLAWKFYEWVELISKNWELFYGTFVKNNYPRNQSMDLTCSLAAKIMNIENDVVNLPAKYPTFTHMKPQCQDWIAYTEKWQDYVNVYMTDKMELYIGNFKQSGIFHYTEDDFIDRNQFILHISMRKEVL